MSPPGQPRAQLDWLVSDFTRDTPGVRHALVVSGDGLLLASSTGVDAVLGDHLSAATSGLVSLSKGMAQLLNLAPVSQTIVEMGRWLPVRDVDQRRLHARRRRPVACDMGLVGYEMTMQASRVGHATPPPRHIQERMEP